VRLARRRRSLEVRHDVATTVSACSSRLGGMAAGPQRDLSQLFDAHVAAEFVGKDADATMSTMTADPTVIHVPVLTGGRGVEELHAFYRDWFIPSWPDDVELVPLSRTVDADRVVDEFIVRFTHTREMPYWLPGIAPTGRRVEIPHVVIMGFDGDKVAYERIYWDQASLLVQVGLLDSDRLPVIGRAQAQALVDPSTPMNEIIVGRR
jgi:carboxymethylenebutenolidase